MTVALVNPRSARQLNRATLTDRRYRSPKPPKGRGHTSTRIMIVCGNGLVSWAYARAAHDLGEPRYLEVATRATKFLRANLYDESHKLLCRSYREGRSHIEGFADDYAFLIQGL